jgi:hypothetical protein
MSNQKTEIPQMTRIPTNTADQTPPVSLTPTRTKQIISTRLTSTPAPSMTKTQFPFTLATGSTSSPILDGQLIVLREFNVNYLEDILTGRGYNLLAEGKAIDILKWEGTGCTFIAVTRDGIIEIDLEGKILRNVFAFKNIHNIVDGHLLIDPPYFRRAIDMLSPDKSWLVYRIGSGKYEQRGDDIEPYRFEYENIETMSLDGTQGPFRLSQNGGAWRVAWSPGSQQISYSDYDNNGVHQIYLIDKDGANRKQVTFFPNPQLGIMKILWSPDGEKLAVVIDQDDDGSVDDTIVLKINGSTSPKEYKNIFADWWRDNHTIIAGKLIEQEPRHGELIILDTRSDDELAIQLDNCYRINPFGNPAMVGCLRYDDKFIVYDTYTSNVIVYPNFEPLVDTQYWIAAPDDYPGANGCGYNP